MPEGEARLICSPVNGRLMMVGARLLPDMDTSRPMYGWRSRITLAVSFVKMHEYTNRPPELSTMKAKLLST